MARKKPADAVPPDPSPADRAEPTKPARKRPGRRKGDPRNTGRSKDPAFTRAMREAQAAARRNRRRRLTGHLADARRTVAECGMEGSPLGERIAARLAQIEHEIGELGSVVERVGRVKRDGTLSPSYEKRLGLIREDRAELRALVDKLAEITANTVRDDGPVDYRILSATGEPFDFGFGQGAQRPMPADPLAATATPLPGMQTAPEPVHAAQSEPVPPIGTPSKPRPMHPLDETPLQRAWRLGQAPDGSEYD